MDSRATGAGGRVALATAALLAVLIAAQAVAFASSPDASTAGMARAVGSTGFAYLYGLRTFAAAVLWNRVEPLYHDYYSDKPLSEQYELMPTAWIVQKLDPQFEQPYYIAAYVIAKSGDVDRGLDIAREGVENNPDSGLLRASYAQILLLMADDPAGARKQVDAALLNPDTTWADDADRFEALAIFATVLDATGAPETAAVLRSENARMREELPEEAIGGDHDHDGDGVADH